MATHPIRELGAAPATQIRRRPRRFSYLLIAELTLIVGFPVFEWMEMGLYGFLGIAVFAAALYAVFGEGRWTAIAFALSIPAIAGNFLASFAHTRVFFVPGLIFGVVFLGFVTALILRSVISAVEVSSETLYGAVAGYILIGLTWGAVFFLIATVSPAAFRSTIETAAVIRWPDFMFFSFVTLTTIGYGDIVPVSALAKSLVILEAVTGTMFPAVTIARLVALYGASARRS